MELTNTFEVVSIKKRTSSKLFKDVKQGDHIKLNYEVNGMYKSAPMIEVLVNNKYVGMGYAHQIKDVMVRAYDYREAL